MTRLNYRLILLVCIFNFLTLFAVGSSDTLFFNKKWKKCERNSAAYYRLISKADSLYIVNDFYMNGRIQMEAIYSSLDPEVKNGKCTYYNKKGVKTSQGEYKNDLQSGVWKYWGKNSKDSSIVDLSLPKPDYYDSVSWKPQNQSSLIIANFNYRGNLNKRMLSSGHGFGAELGFNFGYFISQKLLLGAFGGWATRDILWNTSFNRGYLNEFNTSFNGSSLNGNDSIVVNKMASLFNQGGYFHDRSFYWGLIFRLPFRYAPIVKVYRGYVSSSYKSSSANRVILNPFVSSDKKFDHDYYDLVRNIDFGVELFLYNGRSRVQDYDPNSYPKAKKKKLRWNKNVLGLSIYIEKLDAYHSAFSYTDGYHDVKVSFERVMSSDFLQKHKTEYNVGLRLSYGAF
jgi:hypothetical protein